MNDLVMWYLLSNTKVVFISNLFIVNLNRLKWENNSIYKENLDLINISRRSFLT